MKTNSLKIKSKDLVVKVWWIPSHLLDDPRRDRTTPVPAWATNHHKLGNGHADRLAVTAAKLHELDPEVAEPIIHNIQTVKLVQKPLVAVIINMPKRKHNKSGRQPKPVPEVCDSLKIPAINSRHRFDAENIESGAMFSCQCCKDRYSKTAVGVRRLLKRIGDPKMGSTNAAMATGSISINGISTHHTHRLCHREGD